MYAPMRRFSSHVRRGKRRRFSGTCAMPRPTMACAGTPASEAPSKVSEPEVGSISFEMTRRSVVLPAPFGPMTPTASPARTSSVASNSAGKPPYPALTLLTASMRGGLYLGRVSAQIDLDHLGIARHLGGLAARDHLAVVEHHAAIHHAHQHAHDVLHPDDGDAALAADGGEQLGRLLHLAVIETAERLVGEQQLRLRRERTRQLELLQARGAELLYIGGHNADERQRVLGTPIGLLARDRLIGAIKGGKGDVVDEAQLAKGLRDLMRAADARVRHAIRRQPADLRPAKAHRPGGGLQRAGDQIEGGAFPRAVRAYETEDLALGDLERDVLDGEEAVEAFGQAVNKEHRGQVLNRGVNSRPDPILFTVQRYGPWGRAAPGRWSARPSARRCGRVRSRTA